MSTCTSGYRHCACRDCFELTIGEEGEMCSECEEAGCEPDSECNAPGAYNDHRECEDDDHTRE